jgi:Tfp pilus assembly protein PilV
MVRPTPIADRFPAVFRSAPERSYRKRAFTILEVMLASIVMAMAITTSITTLQRGFLSIDTARNFVIAGQIMQSEIEKMRVSPWFSTATVTGLTDYTDASPAITIDPVFTSNAYINNRFTLSRHMADPKADLRQITLTVTWNNYDGRQMQRTYTTYYAKFGLYDFFSS